MKRTTIRKIITAAVIVIMALVCAGIATAGQAGIGKGTSKTSPLYCFSHVASTVTNTTAETTLYTCPISGGILGINGTLRVTAKWNFTNSANNKTLRTKFGGTAVRSVVLGAGNYSMAEITTGQNRSSYSDQIWHVLANSLSFNAFAATLATSAIDTTQTQSLIVTGQCATTGETITLESIDVEILR